MIYSVKLRIFKKCGVFSFSAPTSLFPTPKTDNLCRKGMLCLSYKLYMYGKSK